MLHIKPSSKNESNKPSIVGTITVDCEVGYEFWLEILFSDAVSSNKSNVLYSKSVFEHFDRNNLKYFLDAVYWK